MNSESMLGEPEEAPELPIGRFLSAKSLGGNRVIVVVRSEKDGGRL